MLQMVYSLEFITLSRQHLAPYRVLSKAMPPVEHKYNIHDKEMLATIRHAC